MKDQLEGRMPKATVNLTNKKHANSPMHSITWYLINIMWQFSFIDSRELLYERFYYSAGHFWTYDNIKILSVQQVIHLSDGQ